MSDPTPTEIANVSRANIDYTALHDSDLLKALSDDAAAWAEAWCQHADKYDFDRADRSIMITWFANAIEHSSDVRRWRSQRATMPVLNKGLAPFPYDASEIATA